MKHAFQSLLERCSRTLEQSFEGDFATNMARSNVFIGDLENWTNLLKSKPENILFELAKQEYFIALLNVSQGQYRNSFKSLRLVLELIIQGCHLSCNLIDLSEWLRGAKDTSWSTLVDGDRGPLSKRYCTCFFEEASNHIGSFNAMARTLYRELSETIHGNIPNHIPLPTSIEFNQETFNLWHEKAETTRIITLFCLTIRYAKDLRENDKNTIELSIIDQLGHIESIRTFFGGPETV